MVCVADEACAVCGSSKDMVAVDNVMLCAACKVRGKSHTVANAFGVILSRKVM